MTERALVISAGGGIGDAFLATPVVRALQTRYAQVDMLVLAGQRETVAHAPAVGKVLVDEGSLAAMASLLRRGRYSASVTTWATLRTTLLPLLAGIPVRVGQARRLYSPLFTRRVTIRSELGDRTTHWTDVLLDYARAIGCDGAAQPQFALEAEDAEQAEIVLPHFADRRFVVLHPTRGISHARERWPRAGFVALVRTLAERCEATVLVSGSQGDAAIADEIAQGGGGISIAGRTSIGAFAALSEAAVAVVAMDSGPMHVAAAVGAPTVGVFALQSDEPQRWAPLGPRTTVVRGTYPCPPAHRKETCPDFPCVRELPAAEILAAVDRLRVN